MSLIMAGIASACDWEYGRSPHSPINYGRLLVWLVP